MSKRHSFQILGGDETALRPAAQWAAIHLCGLSIDAIPIVLQGFALMWNFNIVSLILCRRDYVASIVPLNGWVLFCDVSGEKRHLREYCGGFSGNNVGKGNLQGLGRMLFGWNKMQWVPRVWILLLRGQATRL